MKGGAPHVPTCPGEMDGRQAGPSAEADAARGAILAGPRDIIAVPVRLAFALIVCTAAGCLIVCCLV